MPLDALTTPLAGVPAAKPSRATLSVVIMAAMPRPAAEMVTSEFTAPGITFVIVPANTFRADTLEGAASTLTITDDALWDSGV
jgi:hypothetical protein